MAAGAQRELTHDELWDDSALVESWNEALEEYQVRTIIYPRSPKQDTNSQEQKYHSLAARGEKVPVIDIPPKRPAPPSKAAAMLNGTRPAPQARKETPEDVGPSPMTTLPGNFIGPAAPPKSSTAPAAASTPNVPAYLAGLPQAMIGATIQDENLKNMMLSWYYAGYHMGLYEGQQRAWAQMQEAQGEQQQGEEAG
ncbi:hypothetical protein M409DRAFT_22948 [Zasmidium cellare ATCC 36951]|uniref:Survival motor neuron Tudor domain-containing protein n=1 Tax=Zasmidium cellare ATCC 36951 TaxID=1080233 RepID=A0A6A6CN64_ZASCE|nr:uncharacterized protein M409DRAFT_22948 [Zasmidium cellare ATCC 36951]KAF2166896.1 hypothetical protein M409DRAFT_22948 [Zasmidium cellare ATCC 36951]